LIKVKMELIPKPVKFEWDAGNVDKSYKKHGIKNEEAEEIFLNIPAVLIEGKKCSREERFVLLGKSDKEKLLSVVFTIRDKKIRIISARPMSRKEKGLYAKKEAEIYS